MRPFTVVRDAVAPTLTLEATVQGSTVHVAWSATDGGSGVDASTCLLEVREDEGAWQTFSTACVGDDTYDAEPGHTYTFRFTASDNVGNPAGVEAQAVVPYVKKYYYANGQRVALWQGDVVYYLHADHLGSTSLLSDQAGNEVPGSAMRYLPYGQARSGDPAVLPTDYGFTGQRNEAGLGLMHYGARFYSPRLGRFVSADSIVPQPGEPQALNRYSYAANNPLLYVDPTGHQGLPWWKQLIVDVLNTGQSLVTAPSRLAEGLSTGVQNIGNPEYALHPHTVSVLAECVRRSFIPGGADTFEITSLPGEAEQNARALRNTGGWYFETTGAALETYGVVAPITYGVTGALTKGAVAESAAASEIQPQVGEKVYRVFGNRAKAYGKSWTPIDPRTVPDYANAAGLPKGNAGKYLSEGVLGDVTDIKVIEALPVPGRTGGLIEYLIPDPKNQVGDIITFRLLERLK